MTLSRLRRRFAADDAAPPTPDIFASQGRRFTTAQTLVRAFYAFLLYQAIAQFTEIAGLTARPTISPLWPVAWLGWFDAARGGRALLAFYLATNILGAFAPGSRASRVLVFLGLLEYVALKNSFGKIGHSLHLPLLVAGVLVFLPAGWHRAAPPGARRTRQGTLLVFWTAQAAVLLSYTMSGVAKLGAALYQLVLLQPNAFVPGGFGGHIAQRLLQTGSHSLLGDWIIRHPVLTWPLMPAAIYIELFAFFVAFRPSLGRPWAAVLILFHAGTYFTMTITFPQSSLLLALFFFVSPFEPEIPRWQKTLADVPLAGRIWKQWQQSNSRRQVGQAGRE